MSAPLQGWPQALFAAPLPYEEFRSTTPDDLNSEVEAGGRETHVIAPPKATVQSWNTRRFEHSGFRLLRSIFVGVFLFWVAFCSERERKGILAPVQRRPLTLKHRPMVKNTMVDTVGNVHFSGVSLAILNSQPIQIALQCSLAFRDVRYHRPCAHAVHAPRWHSHPHVSTHVDAAVFSTDFESQDRLPEDMSAKNPVPRSVCPSQSSPHRQIGLLL